MISNRMTGRFLLIIISAGILIPLMSCTMKQEVFLDSDGGGSVAFEISLAEYLTDVMEELMPLIDSSGQTASGESFFDLEAIRRDFSSRDGVVLENLESPENRLLNGTFRFDGIDRLLQGAGPGSAADGMICFSRENGVSRVDLSVSRDSMELLLRENPSLNSPLMENFGPLSTEGLTEEEYLEMMEFGLGEESRQGLLDSRLELTVHVEGEIVSQTGGEQLSRNTVRFPIPLLSVLMLQKPLEYTLSYK